MTTIQHLMGRILTGLLAFGLFAPQAALAAKTELVLGAAAVDVGNLDPHYASSTSDRILSAWIFGALVRFAPGSTDPASIEPDLAESWQASDDRLVWTFKLRPGVQWHHGQGEVTADDVVFSLEKSRDPKRSAFASDYAALDKIEALDPRTVRISLKSRVPSLLGLLSNYAGGFIVPKKAVEERGEGFRRNPVGFGPFQLQSITPGQAVTFVAHDAYFRGKPKLTKITYRFLNNSAARDLAFVAGEVDAATGLADQRWLQRTSSQPGATVDTFDPAELNVLHVDITKPPLTDLRVRQAIAHAIDAGKIAQFRGPRFTRAGKSAVPSNNLGFTENAGVLPHDRAKAKALLKEAGFANGLTITMLSSQLPSLETTAQIVQGQLSEAGITLNLQPVEHATWHQMIRKDLSPLVMYGAARFPIADNYLTQFYHSAGTIGKPGAITNFSHCDVADKQIEAARSEIDPKKQIELWQEAQRLIIGHVCAIPIVETGQVWARKQKLQWGFKLDGSMSLGPLVTEQTHFVD
jgi:peptide/nickel transport system substrate-binding protein